MKHEIFVVLMLATTIAQANGLFPYNPNSVFIPNPYQNSAVTSEQPVRINPNSHPSVQPPLWNYYSQRPYGYYPYRPRQYPLFYYLPEIREANLSKTTKVPEFHDINDILDHKSAQAIKRNKTIKVPLLNSPAEIDNEVDLSGSDLSGLTASSLIVSARKQQHLETLIPELLSNQRLFFQDRERLQQLLKDIKSSKKITSSDEVWLQKLSEDYGLPEFELKSPGVDEGSKTISHIDKELSKL